MYYEIPDTCKRVKTIFHITSKDLQQTLSNPK